MEEPQPAARESTPEEIAQKRLRKKAKKLRQKQKKLALKKAEEDEKAAIKREQERKELKVETKKRKDSVKKGATRATNINDFIKTHKGVKYCDVLVGKGMIVQDRKKVRVTYVLRAHDKNGKVLDSGGHFGFDMGKGEVIEGWENGLKGMKEGGIRHIIVPPKAGYGTKDIGGGAGAMLYFEVTLLKCQLSFKYY